MVWSHPLKKLPIGPAPLRFLLRPMLLLSLGLHALLLLIPFPAEKPPEPAEPPEESVSLTQLPPQPSATASPAPSPALAKARVLPDRPSPRPSVALPRVGSRPAAPAPVAPPPQAPAQLPQPAPSPSPAVDPFAASFPRYPTAQPGSFGLPPAYEPFSQKTGDAVGIVGTWFQQQLQTAGFIASPIEQPGRTVYQVSKAGTTKYLTLIPNAAGAGTTIVLGDQLLPADLGGGRVVSPEEQSFYSDLAAIIPDADPASSWQEIDNPQVLPDPAAFYQDLESIDLSQGDIPTPRPGIERKVLGVGQPAAAVYAELINKLQIAYYEVSPQGDYGGGQLYQLDRDGVTGFLNLVPTADGASTAVFVWSSAPR